MAEVHPDRDILILDELDNTHWSQYQGFIDRLIELGVFFPFDKDERPPKSPPADLSGYRVIAAPQSRRTTLGPALAGFRGSRGLQEVSAGEMPRLP